jgi:phage tail sheath protein FI
MAKKFDFLSPGVEIREIDQSYLPAEVQAEGPIIIGRTRKGPANKPVLVKNLDDFVSVFGTPIAGGNGAQGDMWRDGNMTGPTYASYAAQAWLASEESPVVMVRVAGENHPTDASGDAGTAGWKLGAADSDANTNSTAYGLFMIASSSTNQDKTGSLAAVFYASEGALALVGTDHAGATSQVEAATMIQNTNSNCEFVLRVADTSETKIKDVTFNFDRNSTNYIRNVFDTNPQLTNSQQVSSPKTYWLGESFEREISSLKSAAQGEVYGVLLPLQSGSAETGNWGYHKEGAKEAFSGWVISQQEKNQELLFRFKSLHVGEDIQKNYLIAIEDIKAPTNSTVNPYGTFTVAVKDLNGNSVERYTGLNLNPSSEDYIGKRIGDQYMSWNETDRRYRTYGDFQNQSNIIYVELKQFVKDGNAQGNLPAGFQGPVRPKGFTAMSASNVANVYGSNTPDTFAGAFVQGTGSVPLTDCASDMFINGPANFTASFAFPSIPMRENGTDGGAPDPYRAYWGVRPKLSAGSTTNDPDYCDYLRRFTSNVSSDYDNGDIPTDFERSFVFTLDDIVTGSSTVSWTEGAHGLGTSYTAQSDKTFGDLLNLNVKQFLMPLHGGSEGFDITQKEPLRQDLITGTDTTSYVKYSLNKALDSVADPEVVPANLLLMPGIQNEDVTLRMIQTAERRKDVLAIIDLEGDYKPSAERTTSDTEESSLGSVATAVSSLKDRQMNSSYGCAFYPWVQISDNLNNNKLVWVPPSVAALGAFGKSQSQSDVWFAPAGFSRGGLGYLGGSRGPKVIQARQRLDSRERDDLYAININPIATFPAEGVVIFGQKTLQADASALDRINVRRLVLYLKSRVNTVSKNLLFDPNLQVTWSRFRAQVNPILSDVRARFGLADYKVVLDETTTTPDLVDRNIMYAKIFIKPARAIEYIVVDFVITKTGADFV